MITLEKFSVEFYEKQIKNSINWDAVMRDFADFSAWEESEEEDGYITRAYLGSVMSLAPSGKYWTCFSASNVDELEQEKDVNFFQALNNVAASYQMWIESGEGDPTDIFICNLLPNTAKSVQMHKEAGNI